MLSSLRVLSFSLLSLSSPLVPSSASAPPPSPSSPSLTSSTKENHDKFVFTILLYCFIHLLKCFGLSTDTKMFIHNLPITMHTVVHNVVDWRSDVFSHKSAVAHKLTSQLDSQIFEIVCNHLTIAVMVFPEMASNSDNSDKQQDRPNVSKKTHLSIQSTLAAQYRSGSVLKKFCYMVN
ncbi:hypothetical protein FCM35_KLT09033 [Carex littledalei]|uniref:Uncharacterized protein n=1 Tax=Carex littledalei TaxID=544730 RepID=A0A833QN11_9POAL|nr:hypothetical protein FCM35_KLT09033 [Carex littledalei]